MFKMTVNYTTKRYNITAKLSEKIRNRVAAGIWLSVTRRLLNRTSAFEKQSNR